MKEGLRKLFNYHASSKFSRITRYNIIKEGILSEDLFHQLFSISILKQGIGSAGYLFCQICKIRSFERMNDVDFFCPECKQVIQPLEDDLIVYDLNVSSIVELIKYHLIKQYKFIIENIELASFRYSLSIDTSKNFIFIILEYRNDLESVLNTLHQYGAKKAIIITLFELRIKSPSNEMQICFLNLIDLLDFDEVNCRFAINDFTLMEGLKNVEGFKTSSMESKVENKIIENYIITQNSKFSHLKRDEQILHIMQNTGGTKTVCATLRDRHIKTKSGRPKKQDE
jgi:hypothetical protein